ncbi:uncharacterized protein GIQ15_00072 [Arthroderma uncinatum]|uniref:uncharacterized protein n=1 Tax=Arthroderma uncinatum TaxID=74035 RepID=UPI00144AAD1C|nr:uncharacterized protein GIQ15_00072 [Arthroderma uncinatum]KAF3490555.1 hypothetical protein GIQ15_00072 [Arthroderma uncinatum]
MADAGRKDFLTKAQEELTPDSTKSQQDKIGEAFTDTKDRIARGAQPDDSKGTAQKVFDKGQRASDNNSGGATQTIGEKVKGALGMDTK